MATVTELTLLAVKSSCDETGAVVMRMRYDDIDTSTSAIPEVEVLADTAAFSMEQHVRFGGMIPEIVSHAHLEVLQSVVSEVRVQTAAKLSIDTFIPDTAAATAGPGFVGVLLVGPTDAKAYVATWGVPFYGINRLDDRVTVGVLDGADPSNAVALLVSGGHTQLLCVQGVGHPMGELGSTLNDTIGEICDKVSRLLGLGYSGGPIIDKLAEQGNRKAIAFPWAMMCQQDARRDFSFSGLKTAVVRYVEAAKKEGRDYSVEDACASSQGAVCDMSAKKAARVAQDVGATTLLLGSGVTTNSRLREFAVARATSTGITLHVPPTKLYTDSGVIISAAATHLTVAGAKPSGYVCPTDPSMSVEDPMVHQAVAAPHIHVEFH